MLGGDATDEARTGEIEMIDINELRQLAQAVSGWGNCNQAWIDQSEDVPAVVVGHIGEDGETYPVVTIDCDQYYAADQSLPLGKFIAAANPAAINELLDRLELAESSVAWHRRRWMALQMHKTKMREPERTMVCDILAHGELMHPTVAGDRYAIKDAMEKSK